MADMKGFFEIAASGVEIAGILLLMIGLVLALARFVQGVLRPAERSGAYATFRRDLGRPLLLSLEFLVASDIIYTIAVERTFDSLAMLGMLVLIRTFLSFSLEVEISGRWPWQGRGRSGASD